MIGAVELDETDLTDEERKISVEQIRRYAPLLRLDKVRAGDILLTRGRGLEARAIALASVGRWSHVALWVPNDPKYRLGSGTEWPSIQLIEADDIGTGPTQLRTIFLKPGDGSQYSVARLPGDPEDAVLLRHPGLDVSPARLDEAYKTLAERDLYRNYPPLDHLVGAASLPSALRPIVSQALRLAYRSAQSAPRPGPFCSELAANFYHLLDVSLFDVGHSIEPRHVSPNHLAGKTSLLTPVEGAILFGSGISEETVGWNGRFRDTRSTWVRVTIEKRMDGEKLKLALEQLDETITTQGEQVLLASRQVSSALHEDIRNNLLHPSLIQKDDSRRIAYSLYTSSVLARSMDTAIAGAEAIPTEREGNARFHAALIVREVQTTISRRLSHDFVRTTFLALLRANRVFPKKMRSKDRKKLIRRWQSVNRSHALTESHLRGLFKESPEVEKIRASAECQAYVEEMMTAAAELAARDVSEELIDLVSAV